MSILRTRMVLTSIRHICPPRRILLMSPSTAVLLCRRRHLHRGCPSPTVRLAGFHPPAPPPRLYQQPRPPVRRARHLPLSSSSRRPAPHRPNEILTNTCCSCGNPAPHQCINSRCVVCCSTDDSPCHASCALGLPSGAPPLPPPPPPPPARHGSPSFSHVPGQANRPILHRRRGQPVADASRTSAASGIRPPLQRFRHSGNGLGARW